MDLWENKYEEVEEDRMKNETIPWYIVPVDRMVKSHEWITDVTIRKRHVLIFIEQKWFSIIYHLVKSCMGTSSDTGGIGHSLMGWVMDFERV